MRRVALRPKYAALHHECAAPADMDAHRLSRLEAAYAAVGEAHGAAVVEPHHELRAIARVAVVLVFREVGVGSTAVELHLLCALHDARREIAAGARGKR